LLLSASAIVLIPGTVPLSKLELASGLKTAQSTAVGQPDEVVAAAWVTMGKLDRRTVDLPNGPQSEHQLLVTRLALGLGAGELALMIAAGTILATRVAG